MFKGTASIINKINEYENGNALMRVQIRKSWVDLAAAKSTQDFFINIEVAVFKHIKNNPFHTIAILF